MPESLPEELKAFLFSCVDSVEQLETLTLVGRSGGGWTAHAVGERLGLSDLAARHHLETLAARGLLQISVGEEVSYSYGPKTTELRRYAELLFARYADRRGDLLRFVAASPGRLKQFSKAFKLRDPE